jgi:hypothetical protein
MAMRLENRMLIWKNTIKQKEISSKMNIMKESVVKSLPGADSPRELEAKAAKIQKDYIDGKR